MDEFLNYQHFLDNKYKKIYITLITNIIDRKLPTDTVYENHHILPKSMTGSNDKNNMIRLTLREHFICHHLLTKFTKGKDNKLMILAFHTFFCFHKWRKDDYNKNSRQYAYNKIRIREILRGISRPSPKIFKFKHRKNGKIFEGNRSDFKMYSGLTPQEIYNITSKSIRWSKQWGVFYEDEGIYSFEVPIKPSIIPKIKCKYCNNNINPGNYGRWHGEKCKMKNPIIPTAPITYKFRNIKSGEIFDMDRNTFRKFSNLSVLNVHDLISKRTKSAKGWDIYYKDQKIFSSNTKNKFFDLPKKCCEHCNKEMSQGNYAKWHGEKCKKVL